MNTLTKTAAAALAATIVVSFVTSAFAINLPAPQPRRPAGPHVQHSHDLSCKVIGTNLIITNFGDTNADSGRQVAWSSPDTADGGTLMLPKMLAPGEQVLIADILTDFATPGDDCEADFVV